MSLAAPALVHLIVDDRLRFPNSLPFALQRQARALHRLGNGVHPSLAFRVLLQFPHVLRSPLATNRPLLSLHHAFLRGAYSFLRCA